MGFGKALGSVGKIGLGSITSGASFVPGSNSLKNLLLGKKSEGVAGGFSQLDPAQQEALSAYQSSLGEISKINPSLLARIQTNQQEQALRSGAEDQERRAQALIAQRGLGRSSVGLNALLGAREGLNEKLIANRAMQNLRQSDILSNKLGQLGQASSGINALLGTRMYTMPEAGGVRSGGLLGLGLGAAGAYGAYKSGRDPMAGFQTGQGIGRSISNFS